MTNAEMDSGTVLTTIKNAHNNVKAIIALGDTELTADVACAMDTQKFPEGGHARFLWKAALRELARGEGGEPTALSNLVSAHRLLLREKNRRLLATMGE